MPTFNAQQLIADLSQQTEDIINEAVTHWRMRPQQLMLHKESEDKWSAAQCLTHLNSYGNYYLPAVKKSIVEAEQKGWQQTTDFATSFIGN